MLNLVGPAIVLVSGLFALLWLPLRIRAVWNGEKSAPPIPIKTKFYHIADFEVTDRTFPIFGGSLFCLAVSMFLLSFEVVLRSVGISTLQLPLSSVGAALLAPTFLFAIISQIVYSFGRPKFLIPPHLRDEYDQTSRSNGDDARNAFDFTNEEVQQLLQTDEELLDDLEELVADDLAHLVYEGDEQSHYAVLDSWWNRIASDLGYDVPVENDGCAYFVKITSTAAYLEHVNRVWMLPEVEGNDVGTSPFVVEHRDSNTSNTE